jgi:hypothetical protein
MIKLPDGHPDNLDRDHSFLEWVKDASLQQPLSEARETGRIRITATMKLLSDHVAAYLRAVENEAGVENADARVATNVRNEARKYANLAEIFRF